MNVTNVLVASHGTPGALMAEQAAIDLCRENGAALHHLLVVPDFWKGMMGDDWLNNAVTRSRFGDYVENQLARDAAIETERMAEICKPAGISCSSTVRLGKSAVCLISATEQENFDIVVIGSPRPRGTPGYRSRMDLELLARSLTIPLLTVPHPQR
ncbi:MAG: universal stress protein [Gammaproteobacteria bacterium]